MAKITKPTSWAEINKSTAASNKKLGAVAKPIAVKVSIKPIPPTAMGKIKNMAKNMVDDFKTDNAVTRKRKEVQGIRRARIEKAIDGK